MMGEKDENEIKRTSTCSYVQLYTNSFDMYTLNHGRHQRTYKWLKISKKVKKPFFITPYGAENIECKLKKNQRKKYQIQGGQKLFDKLNEKCDFFSKHLKAPKKMKCE